MDVVQKRPIFRRARLEEKIGPVPGLRSLVDSIHGALGIGGKDVLRILKGVSTSYGSQSDRRSSLALSQAHRVAEG